MVKKDIFHNWTIIKKNGTELKVGYGILTKNPTQITHHDRMGIYKWSHTRLIWVYYDGDWYLINQHRFKSDIECINYINTHPTYSKEQLFDLIYDLTL